MIDNSKRRFYEYALIPDLGHDIGRNGIIALRTFFDKWVGRKALEVAEMLDHF